MAPAHQRLGGIQAVVGQAQLGLVEDFQLAFLDRLAQLGLQLQALQCASLEVVGEELEAIAAQVLGVLHGHVRLADQRGDVAGVVRQQADAERAADYQLVAADGHGHAQLAEQAAGPARQAGEAAEGVEDHGELVAGQARDGVGFRHRLGQAAADLAQQLVGHFMAEAVIEHLEAVQVDVQQRQAAAALARALAGLVQAVLEQGAVGQARKLVVAGEIAQALLRLAAGGEVGEEADDVADTAPRIAHHIELQPLRVELAVLARVHQFALPAAALLQLFADQVVAPPGFAAADQGGDAAPHDFVLAVAGDLAEGRVDLDHPVLRVEDDDAFAGCVEHRGRQPLLLVPGLARSNVAAGAEHPQPLALLVALHHPATVFHPDPVAVVVAHPVVDGIAVGATLQVLHQGTAQQRQVVRVQARLEVAEHAGDVLGLDAEDGLELGVVHLVGFQVPVPQSQLAGLQGQGQARLALGEGMAGVGQLQGALGHAHLQLAVGAAQFALGAAALFDLALEFFVEAFGLALGLFQVADQRLVLEALQQAALHQPVDLPGHHHERDQQDQAEHAPALQQPGVAEQQPGDGGQQARQGEGEESREAHGIGDAGGEDGGGDQAVDQRLLEEGIRRHQGHGGEGQGQAGRPGSEEEGAAPARTGLLHRLGTLEGGHLGQAQDRQQHQPGQPAAEQQAAARAPEQVGAGQAVEQHEQGGNLRALVEQTGAFGRDVGGEQTADLAAVSKRAGPAGGRGIGGHRRFFVLVCLSEPGAYPSGSGCP
ncbi:hypothetical protein D3C85_709450 [compost metagenome]